jgi:hypothetical protein
VSGLLPGAGHVLLGKVREGAWILLALAVAPLVAVAAFFLGAVPLCWVALRTAALVGAYGVADAALGLLEEADGRHRLHRVPPRRVALLNLLTGGLGYEALGERRWALSAGPLALVLQLGLAWVWPPALLAAEVLLAAAALHGWWWAHGRARRPATPPVDSTPRRLRPALAAATALALAGALGLQLVAVAYDAARHPRRDGVVALEPFYENPHYDLRLEMPSPGWSFQPTGGDVLVAATHLAEDASLRLRLRPRLPGGPGGEALARRAVEEARAAGWDLRVATAGPARLGALPAWALTAEGFHRGRARRVRVVAAADGLRAWILWSQWTPTADRFASGEVEALCAALDLR